MREKIFMIIFVLILGSILTTALVAVDGFTTPYIEKNSLLKLKTSVLNSFDIPHGSTAEEVEAIFSENIEVREKGERNYYVSRENDIAFQFTGAGLWGPITGVISLRPDVTTIKKITVIHQEETPGLGGRIAEQQYLSGFADKIFSPALVMVPEGKSSENTEIDAITGATMSSNAFIEILNSQYRDFSRAVQGE